jgi:hypothetical protein
MEAPEPEDLALALNSKSPALVILPADELQVLHALQQPRSPWRLVAAGNSFNRFFVALSNSAMHAQDNAIYIPPGCQDHQLGLLPRMLAPPHLQDVTPVAQLGGCLQLMHAKLRPEVCKPGALLEYRLVWRVLEPSDKPLTLQYRLRSISSEQNVASRTMKPIFGAVDTSTMPANAWFAETFVQRIPFDAKRGTHEVTVDILEHDSGTTPAAIGSLWIR